MLAVAALAGPAPRINGAEAEAASTLLREIFMPQPPPNLVMGRTIAYKTPESIFCLTNTLWGRGGHQRHPLIHGPAIDQFHRLIAEKNGAMHRPARHQKAFPRPQLVVR